MIKVLLFAITIVFVFWGVGSFTEKRASTIATVNEETISLNQYKTSYNNLIEQYRRQFGNALNDGLIETLNIKKQAIDRLVDQILILQEAEKLGMDVSHTELVESIQTIPAFQKNGVFDGNVYRRILERVQMTPETFEVEQRQQLIVNKMRDFIFSSAKVSDAEAKQWYDWQNAKADVRFVLFEPGRYKDIAPEQEKIAEYFGKNKNDYKTEPMTRAGYIVFDPESYKSDVKVDDEEIRDYYDAHMNEFKVEKSVTARHILIKTEEGADKDADEKARQNAEDLMNQAKQGKDFAELAKAYSQGPSKKEGGYLGSFKKNQMVKPFADKAFSMSAGEISEPVRTRFGWHVIKVESITEETTKDLAQATETIKKNLADRKAKNIAYDRADTFLESVFDGEDLVKSAAEQNINILETELFTRTGPKSFGRDMGEFGSTAFELDVNDISDIKELSGKFYVIQVKEKVASKIPEFAAVQERVENDLIKKIQAEKAQQDADKFIAEVKGGKTFLETSAGFGVKADETGAFGRSGSIPKIGSDRQVAQAAFALTANSPLSDTAVKGAKGYYALELIKRILPEDDGFEKDKKQMKERLLQQKKFETFQSWIEQIKSGSTIDIKEEYIN